MSGEENRFSSPMGAVFADAFEAGALASRYQDLHAAEQIGVVSEFQQIQKKKEHTLGDVSAEGVHSLYGNRLNLSASQVDRLAECRLSYFRNISWQ